LGATRTPLDAMPPATRSVSRAVLGGSDMPLDFRYSRAAFTVAAHKPFYPHTRLANASSTAGIQSLSLVFVLNPETLAQMHLCSQQFVSTTQFHYGTVAQRVCHADLGSNFGVAKAR
jgi:hypothetical protein